MEKQGELSFLFLSAPSLLLFEIISNKFKGRTLPVEIIFVLGFFVNLTVLGILWFSGLGIFLSGIPFLDLVLL